MTLDGHAQGRQEPLGRVEVHHDPLVRLDVLAAGRERLRIEAEVEDDLLGSRRDPAEIGVRRQGAGIVDDDLGGLTLRVLLRVSSVRLSFISLVRISFSAECDNGAALGRTGASRVPAYRHRVHPRPGPRAGRTLFQRLAKANEAQGHGQAGFCGDRRIRRGGRARPRSAPTAPFWASTN